MLVMYCQGGPLAMERISPISSARWTVDEHRNLISTYLVNSMIFFAEIHWINIESCINYPEAIRTNEAELARLHMTVRCRYNAANFLLNSCNRQLFFLAPCMFNVKRWRSVWWLHNAQGRVRTLNSRLDILISRAWVHCDNKIWQTSLNDIFIALSILPHRYEHPNLQSELCGWIESNAAR